jgi:hypothetical protein
MSLLKPIPTDALEESIKKLERIMERDDRGSVYDQADDWANDDQRYEEAQQWERERETYDALEACVKAGVSKEHLKVLARETGMTTFALQQSLKGA